MPQCLLPVSARRRTGTSTEAASRRPRQIARLAASLGVSAEHRVDPLKGVSPVEGCSSCDRRSRCNPLAPHHAQRALSAVLVVLDAMGVLFRTPDGWSGYLSRFVASLGATRAETERDAFVERYFEVTVGALSTAQFWEWCGLDPDGLDDRYISWYVLTSGLTEFLDRMARQAVQVACLTNDSARWSTLLRQRHGLTDRIHPWVVSSQVGYRKPDLRIFHALADQLGQSLAGSVFVDDNAPNLDAAAQLGMTTVLYPAGSAEPPHRAAPDWTAVAAAISAT